MTSLPRNAFDLLMLVTIAIVTSPLNAQESGRSSPVDTRLTVAGPTPTISGDSKSGDTAKAVTKSSPADALRTENDPKRRFAVTDLNNVDADYHNQGEYTGNIMLDSTRRDVGLQVVALGDGQFDAVIFLGGLPGNGFDGSSRLKLTGRRTGEQVVLVNQNLVVYLQTGYAAVAKNNVGERLGFLQPVKRLSPTLGATPPPNAIVLFDGQNTDQLANAKITADGLLEVGCETKRSFQNFTIHGEYRIPYMPYARGQDRGNSGFYLQRRYEVQVLDSFGLDLQFDHCGSLYRYKAPDLNMSFPPLRWQTYDITFTGAKFSVCGEKICKARITVKHNGVVVQNQVELENKTGAGKPEGPDAMPIVFQNHSNPVNYRNIWLIDHDCGQYAQPAYAGLTNASGTNSTCYAVPVQNRRIRHHR